MPLKYRQFRNKITGQVIYMPAGRHGNFLNSIKKLVNYVYYNIPRYYVAHVILTIADNIAEVDSNHLHRVIQFIHQRLKRAESDFKYVAVKEFQDRGSLHYHVLCVYSKPYVFPSPQEVAESWKLGFVKITAPKVRLKMQKIANYMGKYIGKGYEYETLECKKSFTASQIKQIYKLAAHRLHSVISRYGKDRLKYLSCTFRKVFIEGTNSESLKKERILLHEFPSDWNYEGICGEAF
jgi:hypothetical protein